MFCGVDRGRQSCGHSPMAEACAGCFREVSPLDTQAFPLLWEFRPTTHPHRETDPPEFKR